MNTDLLRQKTALLTSETADVLEKFAAIVQSLRDWDLYRINPYPFADTHGLDRDQTLDLFVQSARLGLFDLGWAMICPNCGEIQNADGSIQAIKGEEFHCSICHLDLKIVLDDNVEVTFTINPDVHKLQLNPFEDADSYRKYFFTSSFVRSPEVIEYVNSIWKGFFVAAPGETIEFTIDGEPGKPYRMVAAGLHSQHVFHIPANAATECRAQLSLEDRGWSQLDLHVEGRQVHFSVKNNRETTEGIMCVEADFPRLHEMIRRYPPMRLPFVTGKILLNNQTFRDLFKIQNLPADLKMNIRSLTILFTDLKGSTELYDRTGDVAAYNIIQEHFKLLQRIVKRHHGAIIKTMGDAIMATFSSPLDGLEASLNMLAEIQKLQAEGNALGLKVGLHEGPALAINNEGRLDYFGQTVNISASVQGLAKAGQIWITDRLYQMQGVPELIQKTGLKRQRYSASLKGVGERTIVHRLDAAS